MAAMAAYLGVVAYYLRENALATRALKASRSPPLGVSTVGRSEGKSTDASTLFYPAPAKRQMLVNADNMLFDSDRLSFAIVTDLDHASRDPTDFLWKSHFKRAALVRHHALNVDSSERKNRSFFKSSLPYHIEWGTEKVLQSRTAMRNRSMEFSELVRYDHLLLAVCDVTGLVFKIRAEEGKIFQRWALADGDGEESKPFKGEWATVKDGMLWLGSTGKEWTRLDGTVKHRNSEWVKTIDRSGRIENYDWGPVYRSLRKATNTSFPGYLWHESVHFDPANRRWMFLPRKSSASGPYLPVEDETRGTNLLITMAEDFSDIRVQRLGELEPEYGFSSVRKVPGTQSLFVALKVREVGGETGSKICIFDAEDVVTSFGCSDDFSPLKFEGLSFL
jgi:hypothetical protein